MSGWHKWCGNCTDRKQCKVHKSLVVLQDDMIAYDCVDATPESLAHAWLIITQAIAKVCLKYDYDYNADHDEKTVTFYALATEGGKRDGEQELPEGIQV